ncbi:acyltransferase family protein [Luteolibacter sp. Populi]|uniref:acyltransferase family protein n=1 Tax=Luteolibacter sp. Populi TaxID=3230487 RepID=UPI00346724A4
MAISSKRNTQLDGWRGLAVLGVMWQHWTPASWRGLFPFEIGLYFFLTVSSFLITRSLLRDKAQGDAEGGKNWRSRAYAVFQKKRALRILVPAYIAMLFAWACGSPDIWQHPLYYLTYTVNFHMATMPELPSGTAHYWSLAVQVQFYLLWPLLIYLTPRRWLVPVLIGVSALAPLSRLILLHYFPEIISPGAITTSAFDYFGAGALLALALDSGSQPGDRRWIRAAWIALLPYVVLYYLDRTGSPVPGVRHFQQTLVSIVFAGLICATLGGLRGAAGRMLEHPAIQNLGKLSYGIYLFHTPMPLLVGKILPWLWHPAVPLAARLPVFFAFSWGAAWLCWRWLEAPLDRIRLAKRAA